MALIHGIVNKHLEHNGLLPHEDAKEYSRFENKFAEMEKLVDVEAFSLIQIHEPE